MFDDTLVAIAAFFVIGYVILNAYNGVRYAIEMRKSDSYDLRYQRYLDRAEKSHQRTVQQNDRFDKILDSHEALLVRVDSLLSKVESVLLARGETNIVSDRIVRDERPSGNEG